MTAKNGGRGKITEKNKLFDSWLLNKKEQRKGLVENRVNNLRMLVVVIVVGRWWGWCVYRSVELAVLTADWGALLLCLAVVWLIGVRMRLLRMVVVAAGHCAGGGGKGGGRGGTAAHGQRWIVRHGLRMVVMHLIWLWLLLLLLRLIVLVVVVGSGITPVLRLLSLHPPLGLLHQSEGANVQIFPGFKLTHWKDGNVFVLKLGLCTANRRRIGVQCDGRWIGADWSVPAVRTNGADDEADDAADEDDGDDGQAEHLKVAPGYAWGERGVCLQNY